MSKIYEPSEYNVYALTTIKWVLSFMVLNPKLEDVLDQALQSSKVSNFEGSDPLN